MRIRNVWCLMGEANENMKKAETKEERFLYFLEGHLRGAEGQILDEIDSSISSQSNKERLDRQIGRLRTLRMVYRTYTKMFGFKFYNGEGDCAAQPVRDESDTVNTTKGEMK